MREIEGDTLNSTFYKSKTPGQKAIPIWVTVFFFLILYFIGYLNSNRKKMAFLFASEKNCQVKQLILRDTHKLSNIEI